MPAFASYDELLYAPLTPRRGWRDDAACRTADPELFFPLPGADHGPALSYCQSCPVRPECLQDALDRGDGGVRGGLSEDARHQLLRSRSNATLEKPVEAGACGSADDLGAGDAAGAGPQRQAAVPGAGPAVADALDEQVQAAIAAHLKVAGWVDPATVRALAAGDGPGWASRWEVALAAVVLLARGRSVTAAARALGEEYVQVKRWRDRRDVGEALVATGGTEQLRRPIRLVGPQPAATVRPGREARTRGAA